MHIPVCVVLLLGQCSVVHRPVCVVLGQCSAQTSMCSVRAV